MSDSAVAVKKTTKIRFDFSPLSDAKQYAVEKDDAGGVKHRWLYGISSGEQVDGHGERMTSNCIESFHRQAMSGDILMYAGKHDVNFVDDLGILADSRIDGNGDWITGYRLFDESDGFNPLSKALQDADKTWRQVNGLAPYSKPKPYGFSIEGDIPEGGIKYVDTLGRRTMDDVELAGVVLVRRPAYRSSIVQAVYKALGIPTRNEIRRALLGDHLAQATARREELNDYYDSYFTLSNALDDLVKQIMTDSEPDKEDRLRAIFDEHASMMIELITKNPSVFADGIMEGSPGAAAPSTIYESTEDRKQDLLTRLTTAQDELSQLIQTVKAQGDNHEQNEPAGGAAAD